jgi:hypothetical protein
MYTMANNIIIDNNNDFMNHINNLIMHNNAYATKLLELEQQIANLTEQNNILNDKNALLKNHVEELMDDNSNKQNIINNLHYELTNYQIKTNNYNH